MGGVKPDVRQNLKLKSPEEARGRHHSRVLRITGKSSVEGFNECDMRNVLITDFKAVKMARAVAPEKN